MGFRLIAVAGIIAMEATPVIFTAKYHSTVASDLRTLAQRASNEKERDKLLQLANLHDKLAKHAAKTSADHEERICEAVRVQRQGRPESTEWVPSPPLQP